MNDNFLAGFYKQALMNTRRKEDAAVAGTSVVPFGTTIHTLIKDKKGGDRGKEWLARMGGSAAGALAGYIPGALAKSPGLASLGVTAGAIAGEIIANRMVHDGKYDSKGNLKDQYKR